MSFVTNNNSRRTKRARVHGSSLHETKTSGNDHSVKSLETHPDVLSAGRKSHLTVTTIGSHGSTGLQIIGGSAQRDLRHATNPDGKTIPGQMGGATDLFDGTVANQWAHPEFPISFSGPGYLSFQSEVKMPHLRGDVDVSGDLRVSGSVVASSVVSTAAVVAFSPLLEGADGGSFVGLTAVANYSVGANFDHFYVRFEWTGKGTIADGEVIRTTNLPFSYYLEDAALHPVAYTGVYTINVGGSIIAHAEPSVAYLVLQEYTPSAATKIVNMTGVQFEATGSMTLSGTLSK